MRFVRVASLFAAAVTLASCKGSEPKPITITISPEAATLAVGETQQFTATVGGTDNSDVTWSTSASTIATVTSSGLVTAVGVGAADVTAASSENSEVLSSATVTVTSSATALTSGVAVTGISGAAGSSRHYRITVPTGATQLSVSTNGTGDLDLYVRRGTEATRTIADCDSEGASAAESCVIANPTAGEWYIMLYGFTAYSNVSLTATVTGGSTPPASGFTIANSTSTPSVVRGSSTTMTVTATRAGTFTGAIDLTVTGLPSGVTASFAPAALSSSQTSSTLTLTASATATTGAATITVRGNSTGQTERTATATLTVNAAGGSSITLDPSTDVVYVGRGQYTWITVGVKSASFSGTGSMVAEGLAAGLTGGWMSNEDATPQATGGFDANSFYSRMRLSASASASLGTTSFTVRATPNGGTVPAATVTFSVVVVDPQAAGNPAWTQLALGSGTSCGRRANGKTYCWGGLPRTGDGTAGGGTRTPYIAAMGREFTSVGYGAVHGCGVEAGKAYCWGTNNGAGLLGNGLASDTSGRTPVLVSGGQTFASITVGHDFTCALTPAGAAYCWGSQLSGALGDGVIATTNNDIKTTPTAVLGGVAFTTISAGSSHTCGLTAAGAAWCWGSNASGQLGDGSQTTRAQPVQVTGGLTFTKISAGSSHTCAMTAAGKIYCWGNSNRVGDAVAANQNKTSPYALPTANTFSEISAGWSHSCAITTAGVAYCWGDNYYGAIGNGTSGSTTAQRGLTAVSGGLSFSRIMAKEQRTCGVTTANALYCWGDNLYGPVGDGTQTNRTTPTLVKTF